MKLPKFLVSDVPTTGALLCQLFIVSNLLFVCSDTENYLNYPIPTLDRILSPGSLFYFINYFSFFDYNIIQLSAILSIILFYVSTKIAYFGRSIFFKLVVFTSPFFLSIVGLHLWTCGIKSGLSLSVILLASVIFFFQGSSKYSSLLFLSVTVFGLFLHWSSFLLVGIAIACYYFRSPFDFKLSVSTILVNKFKLPILPSYLSKSTFLQFSFLLIISILFYLFVGIFFDKYEAYGTIFSSESSSSYGKSYPLLALYQCCSLLYLLPRRFSQGSSNLLNFCYNLTYFNSILSFSSLLFLSALSIRIILPLQFIVSFLSFGFLSDKKLALFASVNTVPYLYYIYFHFASYSIL